LAKIILDGAIATLIVHFHKSVPNIAGVFCHASAMVW